MLCLLSQLVVLLPDTSSELASYPIMASSNPAQETIARATKLIGEIKTHYAGQPEVYEQWLDIMADFRTSR